MARWLDALAAAEREGRPAVLVTLLAVRGSAPREAGAKMVVSEDGITGTIGGGNLEYQCGAEARTLLESGFDGPATRDFPLGPALGQCCGGHVTVLFDVVRPPRLNIALFGAGHVGTALVRLLADLPCRVTWIDPRPEALPAVAPTNVSMSRSVSVDGLPKGCVVLVMTHDHALDFEIVAAALARDDLRFVGLIGSETKRARFVSRLGRTGVTAERLVCPIGVRGIEGKEPAVVAVSVAAQILQLASAGPEPDRRSTALNVTAGVPHVTAGPGSSARDFGPQAAAVAASHVHRRSLPMPASTLPCGDCVCPPAGVR
jgi:xanthine dehydrogenase accessory factor